MMARAVRRTSPAHPSRSASLTRKAGPVTEIAAIRQLVIRGAFLFIFIVLQTRVTGGAKNRFRNPGRRRAGLRERNGGRVARCGPDYRARRTGASYPLVGERRGRNRASRHPSARRVGDHHHQPVEPPATCRPQRGRGRPRRQRYMSSHAGSHGRCPSSLLFTIWPAPAFSSPAAGPASAPRSPKASLPNAAGSPSCSAPMHRILSLPCRRGTVAALRFIRCDVTCVAALRAAMTEAAEAHGPITVLINNAADDTRHTLPARRRRRGTRR